MTPNLESLARECCAHAGKWGPGVEGSYAALLRPLFDRITELEAACAKQQDEVCQILGKVLGCPWYKDDQKNFPGATEADGVYVGEHTAESLAVAAERIRGLDILSEHAAQTIMLGGDEQLRRIGELGARIAEQDRFIAELTAKYAAQSARLPRKGGE